MTKITTGDFLLLIYAVCAADWLVFFIYDCGSASDKSLKGRFKAFGFALVVLGIVVFGAALVTAIRHFSGGVDYGVSD